MRVDRPARDLRDDHVQIDMLVRGAQRHLAVAEHPGLARQGGHDGGAVVAVGPAHRVKVEAGDAVMRFRIVADHRVLAIGGALAGDEILRLGPESVIAFIAETVVGATAGAVPPAPGYFRRIREICDRYGVLLILDEVMCGMGRTGTLHACTDEGIAPDIMVVAKGLGAGYVPLGAVLCSGEVYAAFAQGSGAFSHGHTFVGHPVATAAALAVQRAVAERGLLDNVRRRGAQLRAGLEARLGDHPNVGDIRGRGLFQALEFVADRETKAPFDPARRLNAGLRAAAMERGLLVYAMGGTVDGRRGDHVLLAPPYTITGAETETLCDRLADAVAAVLP